MRPVLRLITALLFSSTLLACAATNSTLPSPETPERTAAIEAWADRLMAQARARELGTTAQLKQLAGDVGGTMIKLKYRLKSRGSLLRKVRKVLHEKPNITLETLVINDSLRYTMGVDDAPGGHHVRSVVKALTALQASGHTVIKVKNYWRKGDNYSGVNTVLRSADGLEWELQFHTMNSADTNNATHPLYKVLRRVTTPLQTRQIIYDEMASYWEKVPVPEGILMPKNLHDLEQIIFRDRP
ncbi:MAG: hypothetical protein ACI9WU_002844 [Myxococcota bacterium]|jgi:hypothetical protein